jgi:DNA-binding NarL/FixJ family response regulator
MRHFRTLVVDDVGDFRHFFCSTLEQGTEYEVVGEASDGLQAVLQAQQLQPDLILLDIGLPTLNGIEAARQIRAASPDSKILFVSENRSPDIVEEALSTAAGGYVVKSDAASELLPAIDAIFKGKRFVSASLAARDLVTSHTRVSVIASKTTPIWDSPGTG